MRFYVTAALAFALTACAASYDEQRADLEKFVAKRQVGSSPDFFLVKDGLGGRESVAMVFGMADDYQFCAEIAELYMKRYPQSSYSCSIAQK